jgi:hypothetical protein
MKITPCRLLSGGRLIEREVGMKLQQWKLVLLATLAATAAAPCLAETGASPAASAALASVPDFSGIWWHPSLPGPEPPRAGPGPVTNKSREKERGNVSNYDQLVGDYSNPILQPWAAALVKRFGDLSLAGVTFPSPSNQCWPMPIPYIYKNFGVIVFQHPDRVTMVYDQDHEVRQIRLNAEHPAHVTPSWYGDSVGHYEGDTLVIDTIGVRTDRPFGMIDLYGTPYTKALHVVERYRLVDYDEAKDGIERDAKENRRIPGFRDPNYRGKYLQLVYTVEDKGSFTMPWTATITYGRGTDEWPETVCSENIREPFQGKESDVPRAARADF